MGTGARLEHALHNQIILHGPGVGDKKETANTETANRVGEVTSRRQARDGAVCNGSVTNHRWHRLHRQEAVANATFDGARITCATCARDTCAGRG